MRQQQQPRADWPTPLTCERSHAAAAPVVGVWCVPAYTNGELDGPRRVWGRNQARLQRGSIAGLHSCKSPSLLGVTTPTAEQDGSMSMMVASLRSRAATIWKRHAMLLGSGVTGVKTCVADLLVQTQYEQREEIDWSRTFVVRSPPNQGP